MAGEAMKCDRCGREAEGFAFIGDKRLCHPDYGPGCEQGNLLDIPNDVERTLGRIMAPARLAVIEEVLRTAKPIPTDPRGRCDLQPNDDVAG